MAKPMNEPVSGEVVSGGAITPMAGRMGEVDIQVSTAKTYPRDLAKVLRNIEAAACMSEEVAASCLYAIPRDNKIIEGPSVRFSEILASCWGNLRIEAKHAGEDGRSVYADGGCWDLESNVAYQYTAKRRITNKEGRRYSDDMIAVAAAAAASVARRNAILAVVPRALWMPIYEKAKKTAIGDVKQIATKRAASIKYFAKFGVTEKQILEVLGVKAAADIDEEKLAILKGFATELKDGTTDVETIFPPNEKPLTKAEEAAGPKSESEKIMDDARKNNPFREAFQPPIKLT